MAGKRQIRRTKMRLSGALLMLAVLALLMHTAGTSGVAADSPAMRPQAAERVVPPPSAAKPVESARMPSVVVEEPKPEPESAPEPERSVAVPASDPVEDTYFEDAVFLGDSRTEGFYLYSGLKSGTYYYAVGATVESVFSKKAWQTPNGKVPLLDAMAKTPGGKVYVMLGINELGWPKTQAYHDQYAKLIDRIREDHPDAEVVLESLLPVSAKQEAKKTYVNNKRILEYNAIIKTLAEEKDCWYLDVAEAVTGEDGCLRADLTSDGVHMNTAGCKVWLDYLRTHSVP